MNKKMSIHKILFFLLHLCLLVNLAFDSTIQRLAYAAPGDLDPSFGTDGKVITPIGAGNSVGYAVTVQPDGKVIVAGDTSNDFGSLDFALARYNPDGTQDTTFGVDGLVTTDFGGIDAVASVVVSGTQILAAGKSDNADFALACYNADGTLDTAFGDGGKVIADHGGVESGHHVVLSGTKIIVAGKVGILTTKDVGLIRYNADGSVDTSFGSDGWVTTDFGNNDNITAIITSGTQLIVAARSYDSGGLNMNYVFTRYNADGSQDSSFGNNGESYNEFQIDVMAISGTQIIVGGHIYNDESGPNADFALARYNANGELDTSFGTDGIVITNFDADEEIHAITASDTQIVAAGHMEKAGDAYFALAHYHADGSLDTSFGIDGKVTSYHGPNFGTTIHAITLSDEDFVVTGYDGPNNTGKFNFESARYHANGNLDTTFGDNGYARTAFRAGKSSGRAIATLSDGRVIVAGGVKDYSKISFVLARYQSSGEVDETFGNPGIGDHGIVITDIGTWSHIHAMALSMDSYGSTSFVVAGISDSDFALARYSFNGYIDTTFDSDGIVTTDFGGEDIGNAIAISNTQIIVAGYVDDGADADFALARYNADGSLDEGFGNGGKIITDFGPNSYGQAVALHGTKTIVAGYVDDGADADFALARYNADGSLDASFGTDGLVTSDFSLSDRGYAMAFSDSKIVVAGTANGDFALIRYNLDGSLDTSFGNMGIVTTDFGFDDQGNALTLSDEKIIVVGQANKDFALACYNPDGSLDMSFGTDGKITTDFGFDDYGQAVDMTDTHITVAGHSMRNFALTRYLYEEESTPYTIYLPLVIR